MERPNIISHITERKQLAYLQDFKKLIRDHPGILKAATALTRQAEAEYDPPDTYWGVILCSWDKSQKKWFEIAFGDKVRTRPFPFSYQRGLILKPGEIQTDSSTGLEVTVQGISNREWGRSGRVERSTYLKMAIDGKAFFVKKATATINPGFDEFSNASVLKENLSDLDEVKVVEPQLGYQDENQSWYVSRWEDFDGFVPMLVHGIHSNMDEYGTWIDSPKDAESKALKIRKLMETIETRAKQAGVLIKDLDANLFYNPSTGKFMLIDVTSSNATQLSQTSNT